MKGKAHTLLQTFTDLSQNSLHCIVDGFIGVNLLGRIYECEVKGRVTTGHLHSQLVTHWALTKSLTRTAFQQIALVGSLVKLLRHREHNLYATANAVIADTFASGTALLKAHITERIYKTALALGE